MTTQTKWRMVGGVAIGLCAVMAVVAPGLEAVRASTWAFVGYWTLFLVLFAVTLFCVALDIRYVRMKYAIGKRKIFRQTLGEESFRKAMREAEYKDDREEKKR